MEQCLAHTILLIAKHSSKSAKSGKSVKKKPNWQEETPKQSYQSIWLFKSITRGRQLRKYHPKRHCQCKNSNRYLLVPKLLVASPTRRVEQWSRQHNQGRKIDQRSQQFYLCKLFGVVAIFATKINES